MLNMQYDFTIAVCRPLQTVSTLMKVYRTTRSCEGCGDWCVQQSVREFHDIGLIAISVVEHAIRLHDCSLQTVTNRLDFDAGLSHSMVM